MADGIQKSYLKHVCCHNQFKISITRKVFDLNIIRGIKLRRMKSAGFVTRVGERRGAYRVLVGKHVGKIPLVKHRLRWEGNIKTYLQENLQEMGWGHGLNYSGSGKGQVAGCCEGGNKPPNSTIYGEFLDYLKTNYFLKKDSAPWR
jgi:hypothetical protein